MRSWNALAPGLPQLPKTTETLSAGILEPLVTGTDAHEWHEIMSFFVRRMLPIAEHPTGQRALSVVVHALTDRMRPASLLHWYHAVAEHADVREGEILRKLAAGWLRRLSPEERTDALMVLLPLADTTKSDYALVTAYAEKIRRLRDAARSFEHALGVAHTDTCERPDGYEGLDIDGDKALSVTFEPAAAALRATYYVRVKRSVFAYADGRSLFDTCTKDVMRWQRTQRFSVYLHLSLIVENDQIEERARVRLFEHEELIPV
jgi:hypothetical protein